MGIDGIELQSALIARPYLGRHHRTVGSHLFVVEEVGLAAAVLAGKGTERGTDGVLKVGAGGRGALYGVHARHGGFLQAGVAGFLGEVDALNGIVFGIIVERTRLVFGSILNIAY